MRSFHLLAASFVLFALSMPPAIAAKAHHDQASVRAGLYQSYEGSFHWRKDPTIQNVKITFNSVIDGAVGFVWAFGTGTYQVEGRVTNIRVRCLVNPKNMRLRMWELAPDKEGFVTNGEHKGRFSDDLKGIKAIWRTTGTRQTGILVLNAP